MYYLCPSPSTFIKFLLKYPNNIKAWFFYLVFGTHLAPFSPTSLYDRTLPSVNSHQQTHSGSHASKSEDLLSSVLSLPSATQRNLGCWAVCPCSLPYFFQCERPKSQMPHIFLGQNQAQGFFQGWLWQINVSIQDSRGSQEPTKHSLLPLCFLGRPQTHRRINSVAQNSQV